MYVQTENFSWRVCCYTDYKFRLFFITKFTKTDFNICSLRNFRLPWNQSYKPDSNINLNRCECNSGYMKDIVSNECVDIDECSALNRRAICGANSQCVNTSGGYNCICMEGFIFQVKFQAYRKDRPFFFLILIALQQNRTKGLFLRLY